MPMREMTGACVALVLAAGRGRRFGSDKRAAVLPSGQRMLTQTLERALAAFSEVWVVLRVGDDPVALGVDERVTVVRAERADEGMGCSLAAGMLALEGTGFEAVAVMLGDMAWIEVGTLERLKNLAHQTRIVVPAFEGRQGHPVVFGRGFWEHLQALDGDQGGKRILTTHAEDCLTIAVEDRGVVGDLDTPIQERHYES